MRQYFNAEFTWDFNPAFVTSDSRCWSSFNNLLTMTVLKFHFFQLLLICGIWSTRGQSISFVDPRVVLVENFEGWGTSLAWWADVLGAHPQDVQDHVMTEFFSEDRLNLNIVRYVIGGTTPGITSCGDYRPGAKSESYKDGSDREFDWTRDQAQRRILLRAKEMGVDTFEAFSNSPPDWMTISKCSNGNFLGGLIHNNLDASNAPLFADYATEVIKHFHDSWGVTFTSYAPFNEPYGLGGIGGWLGPGLTSQEGCNLRRDVMVEIVKSVHASLQNKGMDYVKITTADETQVDTATGTQKYFRNAGISNLIEKINVHGYWDQAESSNRRDLLRKEAQLSGHRLWMDEMGWGNSPLNDMSQGFEIANRIVKDFKKLLPSAWVYWLVMEDLNEWGLLGVPYNNPTLERIQYHSGYYSMMQFSKYIKKGYSSIHVNNDRAVAAYGAASKTLVIVLLNDGDSDSDEVFDLKLVDESVLTVSATRTSPTEQNAAITAPVLTDMIMTYKAPPKSITTFVIQNASLDTKTNLVQNSNFENASPDSNPWQVIGAMEGSSGGINDAQSWNGDFAGFVESKLNVAVGLIQNITAPETGYYYLTAWCYSPGLGTILGVRINGVQEIEIPIRIGIGYQPYGFRFEANADDQISIYFRALSTSTTAYIDDVVLHNDKNGDPQNNAGSFMSTSLLHMVVAIIAVVLFRNFSNF